MTKNAFTLIELLAVIVILAIIALIATPIILGIINDAKEQANQRSAEMYLKAINNSIVQRAMENKKIEDGTYNIILNTGNICLKHDDSDNNKCIDELPVEIDGEVPSSGTIIVNNGTVADGTILTIGNITYIKENGDFKKQLYKTYNDGDIVYFDIKEGKGCTKELYEKSWDETKKDYLNSSTGYNGYTNKDENNVDIEKLDNQNSCLKFYAFNDDGGEKLNLLLDHNTTATIEWINKTDFDNAGGIVTDDLKNDAGCKYGNLCIGNNVGPITLLKKLYEDTKDWDSVITPSNYTMDQSTQTSQAKYTIEYSKTPSYEGTISPYKARLITAQEIARITGADKEDTLNFKEESSSDYYYFDSLSTTSSDTCKSENITGCKYGWLYDRTSRSCTTYGCLNNSDTTTSGYWTSSSLDSASYRAWFVNSTGLVSAHTCNIYSKGLYGVRPVIEVSKSKL